MYELIQVGASTYYIDCPAKMGIYRYSEKEVCLIDSGNDKSAGKKAERIIGEQGWELKMIFNTHSHADHIGGNQVLQQRLGVPAYCSGMESHFVNDTILEPSFLYGGYPFKELRNKFLMAQPSACLPLTDGVLPPGMETVCLDGHAPAMLGYKTPDGVCFIADSVVSQQVIEKYHLFFLYDVQGYLDSLDRLDTLDARLFIPSHSSPTSDLRPLTALNRAKVKEIEEVLLELCMVPLSFEEILRRLFLHYNLKMNSMQYVLIGSTTRSYLSYLLEKGALDTEFSDLRFLWKRI